MLISEMRRLRFGDISNRNNDLKQGVQSIPRALSAKPGLPSICHAVARKISDGIWPSRIQGHSWL